jgi:hypothetical protein
MTSRNRLLKSIVLPLALAAAGGAQAVCDVTLSTIQSNGTAVLQADCGIGVTVKTINWFRDGSSLTGSVTLPSPVTGKIHYTTPLTSGTHSYTASGTDNADAPLAAGAAETITTPNPTLTVAPTEGGTIASSPVGITACDNATPANCANTFTYGATVTLTASPDGTHSFSGWSGDCTGSATVCAVSMTTSKLVSANFGPVPTNGSCGTASNSTAVASAPSSNLCATGTASSVTNPTGEPYNYTWTCNGANGGTASGTCSAPKIVAGVCGNSNGGSGATTAPTGTDACNPGTITGMTAGATAYTWTCAGFNTGATSATCSVTMQATNGVCGSANGGNTLAAPTGTAACSAGTITGMNSPAAGGDYTWTCAGLAGGNPSGTCTAHQTVNGACGSANGVAVASAPSTNLCVAGTTATAVVGTGPWTWGCNGVNGGTSTSATACSAPVATGGCGATPGNFSTEDWENYTNSTAVFIRSLGAGNGIAIRFTPSATAYPKGVILSDSGTGAKAYSISTCPGDMSHPVDNQNGSSDINSDTFIDNCNTLPYIRYPGYVQTTSAQTTCWLATSGTYYLNILNQSSTTGGDIQIKNGKLLK